jgi:hypothetical protein
MPANSRYCPECGERQGPLLPSLSAWLKETVNELFLVNRSVPHTLLNLMTRPGYLTRAWLGGQRAAYLRPLRIYLLAAVPLFLVWSFQPVQESIFGELVAGYSEAMNDSTGVIVPTPQDDELIGMLNRRIDVFVPLISIPAFTLASMMVIPAIRSVPVAAIVFALHTHAFILMFAAVSLAFVAINGQRPSWMDALYAVYILYVIVAVKGAFGTSIMGAVLRGTVLMAITLVSIMVVLMVVYGALIV